MITSRSLNKAERHFVIKSVCFLMLLFALDRAMAFVFKEGLDRYFGLNETADVLCIGHSHTVLGIDKNLVEKNLDIKLAKYARAGAGLRDRKAMVEHYYQLHPEGPAVVVYDVGVHLFVAKDLSRNSYKMFMPYFDSAVIAEHVRSSEPDWRDIMLGTVAKTYRYSGSLIALSARGWLQKWTNLKYGTVDIDRLKKELEAGDFDRIDFSEKSKLVFSETIDFIREQGSSVVLVHIPTLDLINNAEPTKFKQANKFFIEYANQYEGVFYLDYTESFSHEHELFADPRHLNAKGQHIFTEVFSRDLERLPVGIGVDH